MNPSLTAFPPMFDHFRCVLAGFTCIFIGSLPVPVAANETPPQISKFFSTYCVQCHGPQTQEADFRVDQLKPSATASEAENWQLVLDNLNLGEMPPESEPQPSATELEGVTTWIAGELRRARRELAGDVGEVVLRRLNRTEYQYTIEDLFGLKGDFTAGFPDDAEAEGFDNIGAALMLSATQLDGYLAAADEIFERAVQFQPRPKTERSVFTLHDFNQEAWQSHRDKLQRQQRDFAKLTPNEQERTRVAIAQLKTNPNAGYSFPVWENGRLRAPTPEDGDEVDGVIAIKAGYAAPDSRRAFRVRHPGWYRFKIVAYGVQGGGESVRLKISHGSFRQGTIPAVADVLYLPENDPQTFEYRLYLQPNDIVKLELLDGENWTQRENQIHLTTPCVAIRTMEMEGPLIDVWPPQGHQTLLGQHDANHLGDSAIPDILSALAPKLFRRQVDDSVVQDYVDFYRAARQQEPRTIDAFKLTVKAMMVSPHFIYHIETPRVSNGHTLANRLSYFLWRSLPDQPLRELASSGEILSPDVLSRQVDRMLDDAKSERFLKDFVGQWLEIDKVGEMQPDVKLYPEYDAELERSMVLETQAFVRELLISDLPLSNLIDSDWGMLNGRMAEHYNISGIDGNDFRRVNLAADSNRGGLLTHASVLNITSNGTTTSPVVRGVWVLEKLLGLPAPPPPPDVPAIEPDIRGASTIQEQLAKHRSIEQCAACHRKIDPYGFALENFDVIGGWREHYRALEPTANPNRPKLVAGPRVIAADDLPRRGSFRNFQEYRRLLLDQEDELYRNVVRQLATFALGRSMDFTDEEWLQQIATTTQASKSGLKTMIRELVTSELFRKP